MNEPLCRFGAYCRTRTQDGPGEATARGFCWPCETHGRYAISLLPDNYLGVVQRLVPGATGSAGPIPSGRVEAPIPINEAADELMRAIAWDLIVWETAVREVARLSDVPEKGVRPYVAVVRGAQTLVDHYSVLLAIRSNPHLSYGDQADDGSPDPDGLDGIVRLTSLHHRARGFLGLNARRESRRLPCPAPADPENPTEDDGCGMYELGTYLGTNLVDCYGCGWKCSLDDYAGYATTLTPPVRLRDEPVLEYAG